MLFRFELKQKIYQFEGLEIGGSPGELPVVLVGNVFYKGMPEVTNHKEGSFEKSSVEEWLRKAEVFSEETGVPHLLDVMAMYPAAMEKYISFIVEQTDASFLVDGANLETRIAALEAIAELGLEKRVIYNGMTPGTSADEVGRIKDSGVTAAVIMAHNELDYSPQGRISALEGSGERIGLLELASNAGIERTLIDTIVFDVPSISFAMEAIKLVKEKLGYPAGCSPANATYLWKQGLRDSVLGEGFGASNVSAHALAQSWGADFLIYGPLKQAKNVIPACALNDAIIAYYAMKRFGTKPRTKSHPLYKIF
jgi:tetrahydromethanopterin S-methyltransferase subunit H